MPALCADTVWSLPLLANRTLLWFVSICRPNLAQFTHSVTQTCKCSLDCLIDFSVSKDNVFTMMHRADRNLGFVVPSWHCHVAPSKSSKPYSRLSREVICPAPSKETSRGRIGGNRLFEALESCHGDCEARAIGCPLVVFPYSWLCSPLFGFGSCRSG